MNAATTISAHQIKNKQEFVHRALKQRFPLDQIDVREIIYDPSKTFSIGEDKFNCTFVYKNEIIQVQPGPLFFDEVTTPADKKIRNWHPKDIVMKLIDEICRFAKVEKQNVIVTKADQKKKLIANLQMPNTFKRTYVNTLTVCVNSRKFKVEFQDDWHKIIEVEGKLNKLITVHHKEGVIICPKKIVHAGYLAAVNAFQDIMPFATISETTLTAGSPHKLNDGSWELFFYDPSNWQIKVKVTAEGLATCHQAYAVKPPQDLLNHIKAAGHNSIRVTSCELKDGQYQLLFYPDPMTIMKGYRATFDQQGNFECEERSLGPAWIDE